LQDPAIADVEGSILDAIARGERVDAVALTVLVRRYRASPRDELCDPLGTALSRALDDCRRETDVVRCAAWAVLFAQACAISDDERFDAAVAHLLVTLRRAWDCGPSVADAAVAIDACLSAIDLPAARAAAPAAVDALERLVAGAYAPGQGMAHHLDGARTGAPGTCADQVRAASALLTAYQVSGRLPYSMLAEELMQSARHQPCDGFDSRCEVARTLVRLARLHEDVGYRAAAVVSPQADYRCDAERLLAAEAEDARARGAAGAIYALARLELESAV
jgi:hypothetical protein